MSFEEESDGNAVSTAECDAFTRAVGHELRKYRNERNLTLRDVSQQVGVSESVLCRIELGRRPFSLSRLIVTCLVLGVEASKVIAQAQKETFPFGWPALNERATGLVIYE
jgi:transcriptional regulator with XRE-family HTH domain